MMLQDASTSLPDVENAESSASQPPVNETRTPVVKGCLRFLDFLCPRKAAKYRLAIGIDPIEEVLERMDVVLAAIYHFSSRNVRKQIPLLTH
jgi:hypothetical protein